jgi:hypothetical protein
VGPRIHARFDARLALLPLLGSLRFFLLLHLWHVEGFGGWERSGRAPSTQPIGAMRRMRGGV